MKKFCVPLLCCILILTGCSADKNVIETMPTFVTESATPTLPQETIEEIDSVALLAVSVPAITEQFTLEDSTEIYSYTAQHMQLIHPNEEIADRVIIDFLNRVDAARLDAESVFTAAQNDFQSAENWYPYFYQIIYSPTRIDYGVLSLFGTQNSYSGAHHGSLSCVAANYDLTTGDVLTLGSIMHMDASKEDFIEILIDKLAASAEDIGLFDGYEEGVRSRLGGDENLYEDFFFTNSGLSFFFAPYEIAPYSSGVVTVEIPYEELPGLIYDGYFPAEREIVEGTMHTGSFMETDMEQFENMAEITLTTGEEIMVIYPEGSVEDVRVNIAGDGMNMPDYTVFAALEISDGNAVVMSLSEDLIERVAIAYTENGNEQSLPLK